MRKATLMFILIVFVGSIMIVNFFGLNTKVYDKFIYVDNISIASVNVSPGLKLVSSRLNSEDGIWYIKVEYEKGYKERTGEDQLIMITPRCYPDNASEKSIKVNYNTDKVGYRFEEEALVPTLIYDNISTKQKIASFNFYLKNLQSRVDLQVKLTTVFVDTITE
ncbi:MAG: hypothetical protein IJW82_07930 [Clostridia bacterium]|nr:hypothetical protein [Clostridia bacterium]